MPDQATSPTFKVAAIKMVNEAKVKEVPIQTGIGYLDHMIDQLNSHAQVGVGIVVKAEGEEISDDPNRLAKYNQVELCSTVGTALGKELKTILHESTNQVSEFSCPLDEALVGCFLERPTDGKGSLAKFTLAPYGIFPKEGRTHIGKLETFAIESFWKALAEASGLQVNLSKVRGDNAHHIVESAFKAFSRALRKLLDEPTIFDPASSNDNASVALQRQGKVGRKTKETSISVLLQLNGTSKDTHIETGIPVLNDFYTTLAIEARMTLKIDCKGDTWVDDHHTAEDVSIAVGQCLTQALGSKAGLNRMWSSGAKIGSPSSSNSVIVTMDLSNRPCFGHDLHETLERHEYVDKIDNDDGKIRLTCEMLEHCLDSLVMNGRMTVHVEAGPQETNSVYNVMVATAKAFGGALRVCAMIDERRHGQTASSKGTLSV